MTGLMSGEPVVQGAQHLRLIQSIRRASKVIQRPQPRGLACTKSELPL